MPPREESTASRAAAATAKPTVELFNTSVSAPIALFGRSEIPARPPTSAPKFTKKDIKDAIPAHCFERSVAHSFMVLARDLAFIAAFGYAATHIFALPLAWQLGLWPLYWAAQGVVMTGVWVLQHECGHGAFTAHKWLNDAVGWVLGSALLVPYHSWAISHAKHHKHTCSVEHDEVFVPSTRADFQGAEMIKDTPLFAAWEIFVMLVFGWPGYITANFSGPSKYRSLPNSHFNPSSALFVDDWVKPAVRRAQIVWSDVGFFGTIAALAVAGQVWGSWPVIAMYVVPYFVVNLFLVLITFLQHTDVYIPHHREEASANASEAWLRGAVATVDRSFGWLLDAAFHHIADTHVAHHLFHEMPFYRAQEATAYVRATLGPYYLRDSTPIPAALWRAWRQCRFIEDDGGVVFYKNAAEYAAKKAQ